MKCLASAVVEKSRGQKCDGRTDGQTDGRTVANTMSPASAPTATAGDKNGRKQSGITIFQNQPSGQAV
jgi:hypothetical protein